MVLNAMHLICHERILVCHKMLLCLISFSPLIFHIYAWPLHTWSQTIDSLNVGQAVNSLSLSTPSIELLKKLYRKRSRSATLKSDV